MIVFTVYCALNWLLNASSPTCLSVAWQADSGKLEQMCHVTSSCLTPPIVSPPRHPTSYLVGLIHSMGDGPGCFHRKSLET